MNKGTAEFNIPQKLVSARLGLGVKEMRARRGPENQWWIKAYGAVFFSEAGVKALQESLAASVSAVAEPEPMKDETDWYTVARVVNYKVLHVVRNGDVYDPRTPTIVWLPKPFGFLFAPRMRVKAIPRNGRDGLLDYKGGERGGRRVAYPRARGKW